MITIRPWRALTHEIDDARSPVRRFLGERFTVGLRDLQRRYREAAPPLAVPPADRAAANPGTVGTAADWLLRFLVHPRPDLDLAVAGAGLAGGVGIDVHGALAGVAGSLGLSLPGQPRQHGETFAGPLPGNSTDHELLARCAWALALLTEVYRGGPAVAAAGPLGRFRGRGEVSAGELLALAPPAALDQVSGFHHVFQEALMPQLAARSGLWAIGPTFTGSELMHADADLVAGGLLLDLKTTAARPSLGVKDVLQVIGYALLDFDDEYQLAELGIFSARYAYLATWGLGPLLGELAGHAVNLASIREEFRRLLLTRVERAKELQQMSRARLGATWRRVCPDAVNRGATLRAAFREPGIPRPRGAPPPAELLAQAITRKMIADILDAES